MTNIVVPPLFEKSAFIQNTAINQLGQNVTSLNTTVSSLVAKLANTAFLNANQTFTGINTLSGDTIFESGRPWADVTAFGAVGNNSNDCTTSIQGAINYMNANHGGGLVFFPPGNYHIASQVSVLGGVFLVGAGYVASSISANQDIQMLSFAIAGSYGMSNLNIIGVQTSTPVQNLVTVNGPSGTFRDCNILGGQFALQLGSTVTGINAGDNTIDNCFLSGWGSSGGCVLSNGANWFKRVKMDTSGQVTKYAFIQGGTPSGFGAGENHFDQCDFSGSFTESIHIDDGGTNNSIATFTGCVINHPINIVNARWTNFTACELGSTSFKANGVITVVGCNSVSSSTPVILIVGGTPATAANNNIST